MIIDDSNFGVANPAESQFVLNSLFLRKLKEDTIRLPDDRLLEIIFQDNLLRSVSMHNSIYHSSVRFKKCLLDTYCVQNYSIRKKMQGIERNAIN